MKTIITLILLLIVSQSYAQTYSKVYYSPVEPIYPEAISETDENGIVIASIADYSSGLLFRIDNNGDIIWQKKLETNSSTSPSFEFYEVIPVADSNFIISGRISSNSTQTLNGFITKIDADGNLLWWRSFDNNALHTVTHSASVETADSGYMFVWSSFSQGSGFSMVYLDQAGNDVWSKGFNTTDPVLISDIDRLNDSTFILVGHKDLGATTPYNDGLVMAINDSGEILWSKLYPGLIFEDLEIHNSKLVVSGKNIMNSGACFYSFGDLNGNFTSENSIGWAGSTAIDMYSKITSLTDSTYFLYTPIPDWSGIAFEIDSNANVLQQIEADPMMKDVMKTSESGVVMLGKGPLLGIKSFWPEHIGTLRLDSSLTVYSCGMNTTANKSDYVMTYSDTLAWVLGTLPISVTNTITTPAFVLTDTVSCVQAWGSVDELSNQLNIVVSPTVSDGSFHFESTDVDTYSLQILSSAGKVVYSAEKLYATEDISLKSFANGVYYYKAYAKDGRQKTGKIILQK